MELMQKGMNTLTNMVTVTVTVTVTVMVMVMVMVMVIHTTLMVSLQKKNLYLKKLEIKSKSENN